MPLKPETKKELADAAEHKAECHAACRRAHRNTGSPKSAAYERAARRSEDASERFYRAMDDAISEADDNG